MHIVHFAEFKQIQREQPLSLPPLPPNRRNWKGSVIAPFAGNNMLALYKCSGNTSKNIMSSGDQRVEYFVQVFHNEIPVPLPVRNTLILFFITKKHQINIIYGFHS